VRREGETDRIISLSEKRLTPEGDADRTREKTLREWEKSRQWGYQRPENARARRARKVPGSRGAAAPGGSENEDQMCQEYHII